MKKISIIIVLFIILISCEKKSSFLDYFPIQIDLSVSDSINLEKTGILRPISLKIMDSLFIFSNWQISNNVSIFNKLNKKVLETVYTGNGPKEVISYIQVENNRNSFMYADRIKKKIFSLDFMNNDVQIKEEFQFEDSIQRFFSLVELNSTTLIGTGLFDKGRFIVYNRENNSYFYSGNYPENEEIKYISPIHKAALYNSSLIGIHPEGKRFALIYRGLFDIYEQISSKEIKHLKANYYFFPEFSINNSGPAIVYKKENKGGFLDITCDSQYIYLLYTDSSFEEMFKKYSSNCGNIIAIYDWDGNPIKTYKLNKIVSSIYLNNGSIWSIDPQRENLFKYILTQDD